MKTIPRQSRRSIESLILAIGIIIAAGAARGADFDAIWNWNGGDGNWTDGVRWTTNPETTDFPSNGASTYNATIGMIGAGSVTLNQDVTIEKFTLAANSTLLGAAPNLTINDLFTWSGGNITGTGIIETKGGLVLSDASKILSGWSFIANSATDLSGGQFALNDGANFTNNGVFRAKDEANIQWTSGALSTFSNSASGVFNKSGAATTTTTLITATFNNAGAVNVNSGTLQLARGASNGGTFTVASGATLKLGAITANAATAITGAGDVEFGVGGQAIINGPYTISGKTTVNGSAIFNSDVSLPTLVMKFGSVLDGSGDITVTGGFTWEHGEIRGSGLFTIADTATFDLSSPHPKSVIGRRVINNTTTTLSGGNFNLDGGAVFTNNGVFHASDDADIPALTNTFSNAGVFNKSGPGTTTLIEGPFANAGVINVTSGTLHLVRPMQAATLNGGVWNVFANSTLSFSNASDITTNEGHVKLSGVNSIFENINSLNNNQGSFTIENGRNFTTAGSLANSGTITAGAGSTLTVAGAYTQSAGVTALNGGTLASTNTISINGGSLSGSGTVNGNVTIGNAGTMAPGFSAGTISVGGNLTFLGSSTFAVQLGGTTAGTQYDTLSVGGSATLAGNLNLSFIDGFGSTITSADSFTILTAGSRSGAFANAADGARLAAGSGGLSSFVVHYTPTSVVLDSYAALANAVWTGATGDWTAAANWNLNPAFPNNGQPSPEQLFHVTVGTPSANITLDSPITINRFAQSAGTLTGSGNLTAGELVTWTGGTMSGSGTTTAAGGLTVSGTSGKTLSARTLVNGATANLSGASITAAGGASIVNNGTFNVTDNAGVGGGAANFQNDGVFNKSGAATTSTIAIAFENSGDVNVNSGTLSIAANVNHSGHASVASGAVLQLSGGGQIGGGDFALNGTGALNFTGGSFQLAGVNVTGSGLVTVSGSSTVNASGILNVANLAMTGGTLQGTGPVTISQAMQYNGGTMSGNGATTIGNAATLTMSNSDRTLSRTLVNNGTAVWSGGSVLMNNGTFTNNGSFTANAGSGAFVSAGGNNAFHNVGVYIQDGSSATATFGNGLNFNNTGAIQVNSGTLSIAANFLNNFGHASVASGAVLQLSGGGQTIDGGFALNGTGALNFTAGGFQLAGVNVTGSGLATVSGSSTVINAVGVVNFPNLSMMGGTLEGLGPVSISQAMQYNGGTMRGAGATTIGNAATLTMSNSDRTLSRTLVNNGTAVWSGGSVLMNNGTFTNNGSFTANAGSSAFVSAGGNNVFNNAGAYIHNGSSATATFGNGVAFVNSGALNVNSGTLAIASHFSHSGSATVNSAAALQLSGGGTITGDLAVDGSLNFAGGNYVLEHGVDFTGTGAVTISGGIVRAGDAASDVINTARLVITGGTLFGQGALNVSGPVAFDAGIMSGDGTTTIGPLGTLAMDGASRTLSRQLVNQGATTWSSGDVLMVGGTFTQQSNTFTASGSGDFLTVGSGNSFINHGLFRVNSLAAPTFGAGMSFTNMGTVAVTKDGSLVVEGYFAHHGNATVGPGASFTAGGGGRISGNIEIESNGNVSLGGVFEVDDGANFTGAGSLMILGLVNAGISAGDMITAGRVSIDSPSAALRGSGAFKVERLNFTNGVMADSGTTTVSGSLVIGGNATLRRGLINDGMASWSSGNVTMVGGSFINNGDFQASASGNIISVGADNVFLNAGTFTKSGGGNFLVHGGVQFDNPGGVNVQNGLLHIDEVEQATGSILTGGAWSVSASGVLRFGTTPNITTNQGHVTLNGAGSTFDAINALTLNTGSFNIQNGRNFAPASDFTNSGTLSIGFNSAFTMDAGKTFSNTGTLLAGGGGGGGVVQLNGHVTQHVGDTLTGGTWKVFQNSTIEMGGTDITVNQADVTLSGTDSNFARFNSLANNQGSFTISEGRNFTTVGGLANSGEIHVLNGSDLTITGDFAPGLDGSTFMENSTITAGSVHGAMSGSGTVNARVFISGQLSPGNSPGRLDINGDLQILDSDADVIFEIAGLTQGTLYDYIDVNGAVALDGVLQLSILDGFEAALNAGDTFTLVTADTAVTGAFSNIANGARLTTTDGHASFLVNYGPGSEFGASNLVLSQAMRIFAPADFNEDGDVDASDLLAWKRGFGLTVNAAHEDGDADGDLDVDGGDFLVWQRQLGGGGLAITASGLVPEPGAACLILIFGCALAPLRLRRR